MLLLLSLTFDTHTHTHTADLNSPSLSDSEVSGRNSKHPRNYLPDSRRISLRLILSRTSAEKHAHMHTGQQAQISTLTKPDFI